MQLEQAIYSEIEGVKAGPIADAEIEKARNAAQRQFVGNLDSSLVAGEEPGGVRPVFRRPRTDQHALGPAREVSAADVQRVAKQYLTAGQPDGRDHACRSAVAGRGRDGGAMMVRDRHDAVVGHSSARWIAALLAGRGVR